VELAVQSVLSIAAVACAITDDTVSDPRFKTWWTDTRTDHLSGCVGLYNLISGIAVAIDMVPELEEVFIYDLAHTVAEWLLTREDEADPYSTDECLAALLAQYAGGAPIPFARYAAEIDRLCRKHLACSWADLAGDKEPLEEAHKAGTEPLEFVKEFREHYELEWLS
jgi:hypothetical protein